MSDLFGHDSTPIALRDYQDLGMRMMRESIVKGARSVLLVAPTGCHQFGTMILMADGSTRAVETIQIGDQVMGPDSRPRNVLHLHRGIDEMFRVSPKKGEPFTVNGDHILALTVTNDGSKHAGKTEFVTVRQWLAGNLTFKHTRKLFRTAVEFAQKDLPIAPYMLGILLGDGCIRTGTVVSNPDMEIRHALRPIAQAAGLELHEQYPTDRCPTFSLVTERGKPNPLIRSLKKLGLMGGNAYDKFVPDDYRLGSTEQRLELLAGLMDTDGSLSGNGYDYISASHALASDVVFLARSVGLAAYLTGCEKKWQNGVGDYWRVSISGDTDRIPCRVERKKARARTQIKNVLVTGFACESVGTGTYYGFECDGDHLYVMGDFTVTHNSGKTTWAADMIRSCREKGGRAMFLAPRRELVHQASARLRSAGIPHGVVMSQADHLEDLTQPVQVCSIDTLISRLFRKGRKIELPDFSLVIMDEAHLAVTERRKDLMQHWPKAILVGLTATPIRKDGRALGMMFEDMVQPTSVKALTDAGHLVPARYFSVAKPDLARIKVTAGDYNAKALDDAMNTPTLVGDIVQHWMELAAARRTVVFCTSIKHSVAVCEQFQRNGVAAEHVDANTPTDEREDIFKRFTSGKTQILTNCLAGETEVLTQQGVKPIRELAGTTQTILTRREGNGIPCAWVDAKFSSFGVQPLMRVVFKRGRATKEVFATPGHDWLIETESGIQRIKTSDLNPGMRPTLVRAKSYRTTGINPSPVGIQHGIWFGDGSSSPSDRHVNGLRICGEKKRDLVEHFHGYITDHPEWAEGDCVVRGAPNFFKDLPPMNETAGYLLGWLMGYFAADGCVSTDGRLLLASGTEENIQRARDVASVLGIGTWTIRRQNRKSPYTGEDSPLWIIGLRAETVSEEFFLNAEHCRRYRADVERRKNGVGQGGCGDWKIQSVEATDRVEEVYCATVPGTHNFALTDEIATGNCFLASYGFDLPALSCVVLARPTKSLMLYLQMIGRGLRPADEKRDCLVIDHSGCVHQHGFADQERAWSLDGLYSFGDKKASKPKEAKDVQPIECPECHAVFSKSAICPECGYRLKTIGEYMETAEGKLVEIATGFEVDKEMGTPQFFQELKAIAEEKGYKPGWASVNFKDKFGDWPPREWNHLPALEPTQATRRWLKSKQIAWIRGKAAAEMRAQA